MATDAVIRAATPADVAGLAALARIAAAEEAGRFGGPEPPAQAAAEAAIADALFGPRPAARAFLAEAGGAVIGAAYVSELFPGSSLRRAWFLKDVHVAAERRGQGVGAALIRSVLDAARRAGADRLELHAHPDNAGARRLYERLGFTEPRRSVYRVDF